LALLVSLIFLLSEAEPQAVAISIRAAAALAV